MLLSRTAPVLTAFLLALALAASASALTINVTFDSDASDTATDDSDGSRLTAIMEAAADYWEDIIQDSGTLDIAFYYDDSISSNGRFSNGVESGGRFTSGTIRFKTAPSYGGSSVNRYYYDPTPLDNSEYDMRQILYRDLSATQQAAMWSGSPPDLLESAFQGPVAAGAPAEAQDAADLWTYALHELGHALGMSSNLTSCATEINDGDYDISTTLTNGASCAALIDIGGGAHVECQTCAMNTSIGPNNRRLPSAADILAIATCPSPGWSDLDLLRQDFLPGGTTDWNTPRNWVGNAVPGSADDAAIRIGLQNGVSPSIDIQLSGTARCRDLLLSEATDIQTNGFKLDVFRDASVVYPGSGATPRIFVEAGGELEVSGDLLLDGGELDMTGGLADVNDDIILSADTNGQKGQLSGFGVVDVASNLINNGRITATDLVSNTLSFTSTASNPWNLDGIGTNDGDGEVFATTGNLNFASGGLTDQFNGLMTINDPFTLNINAAWTLRSGGTVDMNGGASQFANLTGGVITATGGQFVCSQRCLVTAPVNFSGSFELNLLGGGELEMDAFTTYNGGTYILGNASLFELDGNSIFTNGSFFLNSDSTLRTDSTTNINGGTFNIADGARLDLNGTHVLAGGTFTGDGSLVFNGNTTTIQQPVTVGCAQLDLDGPGSSGKQVNLNADLVINSTALEATGNNSIFNSTLNFGPNAGFNSQELRVLGPASWEMAGTMNLNTNSTLTLPSVSGVPFTMSGTTNVNGSSRWETIATISGTVAIPQAATTLSLAAGDAANPNILANGFIMGPGRFRATGTANLVGHGIITAPIDFLGSDSPGGSETRLLASGGTLLITAPFVNVPEIIGTADDTGILRVTTPWSVTANDTLVLNDGSVSGDAITNEGAITGFGTLRPDELSNNGEIVASGGRLVIDTTEPCNLDGLDVSPTLAQHRVDATAGSITVNGPLLDPFDGTAFIGAGHDLTIPAPWELGINGELHMNGGSTVGTPASLLGNGTVVRGSLLADGECAFQTQPTFATGSITTLADASTTLRLLASGIVESGASITGLGRLVAMPGSFLGLSDGATVGVPVVNEGTFVLNSSPSQASVATYTQAASGRLAFVLAGRPATGAFDRLTVSGPAELAGRLSIAFNVPDAQVGDTWRIIESPSLSGAITTFDVIGLPGGFSLLKREQPDGLYLEFAAAGTTYLDWAIGEGIPASSRAVDDDPDGDLIENGLELFLGGDPNSPDSGLLPAPAVLDVAGTDFLSLTVVLANDFIPSDLTFRVTRSTDGVTWSTANVVLEDAVVDPGSGAETRVYRSTVPFATPAREFLSAEAGP